MKSLAVSTTAIPFSPLPAETLPRGMTPPTVVFVEVPSTRMPLSWLATMLALSAPTPRKLPCTTVPLEPVTCSPLPPLPLMTL